VLVEVAVFEALAAIVVAGADGRDDREAIVAGLACESRCLLEQPRTEPAVLGTPFRGAADPHGGAVDVQLAYERGGAELFHKGGLGGQRETQEAHDPILPGQGAWGRFARETNRSGGLEGGMTTGEEVVARVAMKPIPSLKAGMPTVDFESGEAVQATYQRSDVTSVPAASVVGEAVAALVLAAAFREKFGGDSLDQVRDAFTAWEARVR